MDDGKLAELRKTHPRGVLYEIGGQEFFIRPPSREEFRRFQQFASDDAQRPIAMETMATESVVYPERAGLLSLLDTYPAIISKLFSCSLELAGGEQKIVKKG